MKKILKTFLNYFIRPFFQWYLRKERLYRYKNISLKVLPGVFHPGFFFSTKILLLQIEKENLRGKTFLELGAGSGLISVAAAKQGAAVTATDISGQAIKNIAVNKHLNKVTIQQFKSDLFKNIPPQTFDYIIINPPYYKADAISEAEFAWYAGAHLEYFQNLFPQLRNYLHSSSVCLMILNDECDMEAIRKFCEQAILRMELVFSKKKYWETAFVFRVTKNQN